MRCAPMPRCFGACCRLKRLCGGEYARRCDTKSGLLMGFDRRSWAKRPSQSRTKVHHPVSFFGRNCRTRRLQSRCLQAGLRTTAHPPDDTQAKSSKAGEGKCRRIHDHKGSMKALSSADLGAFQPNGHIDRPRDASMSYGTYSFRPAAADRHLGRGCDFRWRPRVALGGWGGIRTHGGREPTAVFKTAALNHSATHPESSTPVGINTPSRACSYQGRPGEARAGRGEAAPDLKMLFANLVFRLGGQTLRVSLWASIRRCAEDFFEVSRCCVPGRR
jgi:hypothetical protein